MRKYESKAPLNICLHTIKYTKKNLILQQDIKYIMQQEQILCNIEYGSSNKKEHCSPLLKQNIKISLQIKGQVHIIP